MSQAERKSAANGADESDPRFKLREREAAAKRARDQVHVYGRSVVCDTDSIGHALPGGRSHLELVVDASDGFIPLWAEGCTLRWRFNEASMEAFEDASGAKSAIRELMAEALIQWGDAAPIRFRERREKWDFEIVVRDTERCNINGCVLASAFFPDPGRHQLVIYPTLFDQSMKERIETMIHEIGHIFGLRHFFAKVTETAWPAEIFGEHNRFSIMNYGPDSFLTQNDKDDLKSLYSGAWAGELTEINSTPFKFVRPYSAL